MCVYVSLNKVGGASPSLIACLYLLPSKSFEREKASVTSNFFTTFLWNEVRKRIHWGWLKIHFDQSDFHLICYFSYFTNTIPNLWSNRSKIGLRFKTFNMKVEIQCSKSRQSSKMYFFRKNGSQLPFSSFLTWCATQQTFWQGELRIQKASKVVSRAVREGRTASKGFRSRPQPQARRMRCHQQPVRGCYATSY